jgi:hypothetical protein
VELGLAQKISGIPPGQIEIPEHHWSVVSSIGEPPPLTPDLFLANRTEAIAKLKEVFAGTTVQLKLTTHSPDQVVDFVSAYLALLDNESRADAVGRCLIVFCLGELAVRDPDGQWSDRAANSLSTIFLPWLPQTCAPVAKRVAVVRTLLTELPNKRTLHDKQPFDNRRAIWALIEALKSSESPHSMDIYGIIEIIKKLQEDQNINPDDLFRVEWAYLPLLVEHRDASPKLLSRRLAEDPRFFFEVIRLVFRSKKEEYPVEQVTEGRKTIATNAYRLLSEWRIPPGLGEDGTYDGNALTGWLDAVKTECTETGHLEIAMTKVGHVLIHVPGDPDGL